MHVRERLSNGTSAFEVMASDLPRGITIGEYRRVRTYNAKHPHATVQAVADALGVTVDAVLLAYAGAGSIVTNEHNEEDTDG